MAERPRHPKLELIERFASLDPDRGRHLLALAVAQPQERVIEVHEPPFRTSAVCRRSARTSRPVSALSSTTDGDSPSLKEPSPTERGRSGGAHVRAVLVGIEDVGGAEVRDERGEGAARLRALLERTRVVAKEDVDLAAAGEVL